MLIILLLNEIGEIYQGGRKKKQTASPESKLKKAGPDKEPVILRYNILTILDGKIKGKKCETTRR